MVETLKKKEYMNCKSFDGVLTSASLEVGEYDGSETRKVKMVFSKIENPIFYDGKQFDIKDNLYNFVNVAPKTTETAVTKDSNLEKYLKQIYLVMEDAETEEKFMDVIECLLDVKIHYVNMKLGKDFKNHDGRSFYVPQQLL